MTQALLELKDDDEVYIDGPYGSFSYIGNGNFLKKKFCLRFINRNGVDEVNNFQYIGLLAEGTGITAYFQMLESIASSTDPTSVSLLYTGKTVV